SELWVRAGSFLSSTSRGLPLESLAQRTAFRSAINCRHRGSTKKCEVPSAFLSSALTRPTRSRTLGLLRGVSYVTKNVLECLAKHARICSQSLLRFSDVVRRW